MGESEETHMVDVDNWWRKKGGWNPKNKVLIVFEFQTAILPWDVGGTEADLYHNGSVGTEVWLLRNPNFGRALFRERLQLAD